MASCLRNPVLAATVHGTALHGPQGKVTTTISRGRVMFEDGHLTDEVRPGAGRYVPMPPHGPLFHVSTVCTAAKLALHR